MVTVEANLQGRVLGEVTNDINAKLKSLSVPNGYSVNFGGNQKQMAVVFFSWTCFRCILSSCLYDFSSAL